MTTFARTWNRNSKRTWCAIAMTFLFSLSPGISASGQTSEKTLVRVEEDWVALISGPDTATSSPQILNFISPLQTTDGIFGLVQVNHRGTPDFNSGGLQVQGWIGNTLVGYGEDSRTSTLNRSSDNLRYTVAMEKTATGIRFQLLNGRSRTWGRFATTPVPVHVTVDEPSLKEYSPDFSVANTNVNLGAHRVDLLYMNAVRFQYSDGQTVTDATDRVIHRYQLNVGDVSLTDYEANPEDYNIDITE